MAYSRPNGDTRFNTLSLQKQPLPSAEMDAEWTGLKDETNLKLHADGSQNMTGTLILEQGLQFLESGDEYIRLPRLTTLQRDALTPVDGFFILNTNTVQIEIYLGGAWHAVIDADTVQTIDGKVLKGYTTVNRDLLTPVEQQILYNLDTFQMEIYSEAQWKSLISHVDGAKLTGLINGGYASFTMETIYLATTDLFVTAWCDNAVTVRTIEIRVGTSSPPTSTIAEDMAGAGHASVSAIIPNGHYYEVIRSNGSGGGAAAKTIIGG